MTDPPYSPWGQPAPDPAKKPASPSEQPQPYAPPPGHPPYGQAPPGQSPYGYPPSPYAYGQAPPPPYGYGYYPQPTAGTNPMAIASLVLAFFCSVAGLVCGIVALNQIKARPQEGRGIAIAGIVISSLSIVAAIGFFVLWVALWTSM